VHGVSDWVRLAGQPSPDPQGVACDDWGGSLTYLFRNYKNGSGC